MRKSVLTLWTPWKDFQGSQDFLNRWRNTEWRSWMIKDWIFREESSVYGLKQGKGHHWIYTSPKHHSSGFEEHNECLGWLVMAENGAEGLKGSGGTAQEGPGAPPAGHRGGWNRHGVSAVSGVYRWWWWSRGGNEGRREGRVSHAFCTCSAVWRTSAGAAHFRVNLAKEKSMPLMGHLLPSLFPFLSFPHFLPSFPSFPVFSSSPQAVTVWIPHPIINVILYLKDCTSSLFRYCPNTD